MLEGAAKLLHLYATARNPTPMADHARSFAFTQFDVFTTRPLEGNPLAVVHDASGLSDSEMQSIAREMNLSETTFILPRDARIERERGIRVRIFTVQEELPFAGHPTLGTAFFLRGNSGAREINLDLNVGTIPVSFEECAGDPVFGEMTQRDPEFGFIHDRQTIANVTGIPLEDIDPALPIETVSTGTSFTMLPIRNLEAMGRVQFKQRESSEYLKKCDGRFFFCVTRETVDSSARLHARMLFYNGEDPATGSASGCCASWMVQHGIARPDERVLIEQGIEMKRPSRIFVRASRNNDRVVNVRVGGNVVEVLRGELFF